METLTATQLRKWRGCAEMVDKFEKMFSEGLPLDEEHIPDIWRCEKERLAVIWAACHLMTISQRKGFILFTLCQRQGSLAALFERARLGEWAEKIRTLTITAENLEQVLTTLDAAWAAAVDAAKKAAKKAAVDAVWAAVDAVMDAVWAAKKAAKKTAMDAAMDAVWAARGGAWEAARKEQVEYCIKLLISGVRSV